MYTNISAKIKVTKFAYICRIRCCSSISTLEKLRPNMFMGRFMVYGWGDIDRKHCGIFQSHNLQSLFQGSPSLEGQNQMFDILQSHPSNSLVISLVALVLTFLKCAFSNVHGWGDIEEGWNLLQSYPHQQCACLLCIFCQKVLNEILCCF